MRVWQAKGSSDQEDSKLDHGHNSPKPPKDRLVGQLQPLEPAARVLHTSIPEEVRSAGHDALCKHGAEQTQHRRQTARKRPLGSSRTPRPSQTEPNALLFLLSTLVWHPRLTDGYFPSLPNNGSSRRGNTSSLAFPAPGLQVSRLPLKTEDEAPDRHTRIPPPGYLERTA